MPTPARPTAARPVAAVLVLAGLLLALGPGCAERRNYAPQSEPVLPRRPVDARPSVQPVDQSGHVILNESQPPPAGGAPLRPTPPEAEGAAASPEGISPTVEAAVRPADEQGFRAVETGSPTSRNSGATRAPAANGPPVPSTAPARAAPLTTRDPGSAPDTTGGYQLIGTVLAEVHDAPIFADKVLASVDSALAAQAPQLDEGSFRKMAADLIEKQIRRFIADELEFAMARRKLDPRDRELARMAAIRWRDEQVTKAGGSIEVARQRAAAAGYDFDELQEEQFRWLMRQLYYQKKEYAKIQVSATDMRRYYQENLQREFTSPDRARFRVIKIDKRRRGEDAARGEINRLLDRARSGNVDFAALAAENNDQESFKTPVDWFQRGAFVVKEVEDAVWALEPGKITDVIETPDAFYLAKLEAKQPGGTRPFNDPAVQQQIMATLRKRQFEELQKKVHEQLTADAIIRYHPRMIDLAVEMAMQKYRFWRETAAAR